MTLISVVNSVQDRLSLPRSSAVVGSTDRTARQMLALLNEVGNYLVRKHDWRLLTKERSITTTATETQTNALPADFKRIVPDSMWNRTRLLPVVGPVSPQQWQALEVKTVPQITPIWRVRNGTRALLLLPVPAAGEQVYFEYVSSGWVLADDGVTYSSSFSADTDTMLFDEELMKAGLRYYFLQAKGLDFSVAKAEFFDAFDNEKVDDGGKRSVNMGGSRTFSPSNPPWPILPDRITF